MQSRCIRYLLAAKSHRDGLNGLFKIHFVGLVAVLIVETYRNHSVGFQLIFLILQLASLVHLRICLTENAHI